MQTGEWWQLKKKPKINVLEELGSGGVNFAIEIGMDLGEGQWQIRALDEDAVMIVPEKWITDNYDPMTEEDCEFYKNLQNLDIEKLDKNNK